MLCDPMSSSTGAGQDVLLCDVVKTSGLVALEPTGPFQRRKPKRFLKRARELEMELEGHLEKQLTRSSLKETLPSTAIRDSSNLGVLKLVF